MALASWQRDGIPVQLHPGDLGWQWRFGADVLADSLRVWSRDEEIVAIGFVDRDVLVDEAAVVRMALAPSVDQNDDVARVLVRDLEDSSTGVLPAGSATVEARFGQAFRSLLDAHGWLPDEPWTPLHRDLTHAVEGCALRVETASRRMIAWVPGISRGGAPRTLTNSAGSSTRPVQRQRGPCHPVTRRWRRPG